MFQIKFNPVKQVKDSLNFCVLYENHVLLVVKPSEKECIFYLKPITYNLQLPTVFKPKGID